ncbi:MAG: radical SAM protein [Magnetococcales bacterium]|nr:radical SAM protein [Magnetococcales bacterium]MBF0148984.1 radical SAM protein [Magnetococcales bacterium]MBF0603050.1 radical SAM protein [Magnetococcales bacterium]
MSFFEGGVARLASSVITKNTPAYVQFYVTSRCNLACEQCNIIYANADQEEVSTEACWDIAKNLAKIGTSVVLLTGGEPFMRKDLPEICRAFMAHRIHPRIQTNGFAKRDQLEAVAATGVRDVSVSLDSLRPAVQNRLNGGFDRSWDEAMNAISLINEIFPRDGFAALGCVITPRNLEDIPDVIRFADEIGWWVSLVPAHVTVPAEPRNFSTFDPSLRFSRDQLPRVREILEQVKQMRNSGHNVYDSDEYLDDIYRKICDEPIRWRRRNGGVCDSPNLYFVVQPNGDMAVCCDYRLPESYPVMDPRFPAWFQSERMRMQAHAVTSRCSGCMYGSFPEISISARFFTPMLRRARLFLFEGGSDRVLKPHSKQDLVRIAGEIVQGTRREAAP